MPRMASQKGKTDMTRHALTTYQASDSDEGFWRRPLSRRSLLSAALGVTGAALLAGCSVPSSNEDSATPAAADADSKLSVVASFYAPYDFATKVAGDHADLTNLTPAGTEPHDWEPAPTDMVTIQNADLLVYNGANMEHWVDDLLASLGDKAPATVKASDGITLRQGSEEDNGDSTDPHVWLAPKNAKHELANIRDALVKVDPDHADNYKANYEKHASDLDELDKEYSERLSQVPHKTIVVSHEAFGYLCDAYGLTQIPITGMDAEGEPDAQTMASIIEQVKDQGVKTIFSEDLVSPKVAQAIADATGATCEVLNPLEGLEQDDIDAGADYVSVMRDNLDKLVAALS